MRLMYDRVGPWAPLISSVQRLISFMPNAHYKSKYNSFVRLEFAKQKISD